MNYDYMYLGDYHNEAHFTDACPICGSNEDIEYHRDSEQWACHLCEVTWHGPPPPPSKQ